MAYTSALRLAVDGAAALTDATRAVAPRAVSRRVERRIGCVS